MKNPFRLNERNCRRARRGVIVCLRGLGVCALVAPIILAAAWVCFPFPEERLDRWGESPVVRDATGAPILQRVSGETEHWRMPVELDEMSPWVVKATIALEDERFHEHMGVDPLAVGRAVRDNVLNLRRVSGASTITMQVCRMMDDRKRTYAAKAVESFRALQLEAIREKEQILETYLNIAPYGGNIRGVEAAAQRYFGVSVKELSLAEAALIAGLPQSPERLRPDRNLKAALARRSAAETAAAPGRSLRRVGAAAASVGRRRHAGSGRPVRVGMDGKATCDAPAGRCAGRRGCDRYSHGRRCGHDWIPGFSQPLARAGERRVGLAFAGDGR